MITELHKRVLKKAAPKAKKRPLKDDFITLRTPADNEKGYKDERVYCGPLIAWKGEAEQKSISKVTYLAALQLALTLAGSLRLFTANLFIQVSMFKMLALVPLIYELVCVVMLLAGKEQMPQRDHHFLDRGLRIAPWVTAVILVISLIAHIWAMVQIFDIGSLIAGLCTAGGAAVGIVLYFVYRRMEAVPVRNRVKEGYKELNDKATGRATGIYVPKHRTKR